ncbi:unnamed protein product [Allacma fusca]|uniref:26S proteasome regulatory subunit RPN7/PSMD6 C-terminal helix domain-containing protein n=1 Tax=Allacma fusca TaxID=39272 RepID=A0A8J2KAX4_9HEXA|nr:unnamed protein product [Allacma fusca]
MEFDNDVVEELISNIEQNLASTLQQKLVFITLKSPQILNSVIPKYGMSLFHYSVGFSDNKTAVVKVLLDHGGDPNNTECTDKVSPLHLSIIYEFDGVLDFLLKHGGDPFVQDGEGKNCYDLVEALDQPDIFKSILVRHTSFSGLSSISSEGSSGGNSDTMSYMTCLTSCNDEPIQAALSSYTKTHRHKLARNITGRCVVETCRPDNKNWQYQSTIKQGDHLLNRIQKLSRVINI